MRAVAVADLQEGMLVGKTLVDDTGRVLLHQGIVLNASYIKALNAKGYSRIFIMDEDMPHVDSEDDLTPELRGRAVSTLSNSFEEIQRDFKRARKNSATDILKALQSGELKPISGPDGPLAKLEGLLDYLLDYVLTQNTLSGLTSLKNEDTALYDHSIDVCVIAIMIAKELNLPSGQLLQLAKGCLLHDLGLLFVQDEPDNEIRIRQHTRLGFELLKTSVEGDILVPCVAYEHHEHQDGTGLPRGLTGSNIIFRNRRQEGPVMTLVGEIAAVANAFDNLTSGVRGATPLPPDEAMIQIMAMAGTILNEEVVSAFRRVTPVFPVGTQVLLRGQPYDGFLGVVMSVTPSRLDKPRVILARDAHRNKVPPEEIETAEHPKLKLKIMGL